MAQSQADIPDAAFTTRPLVGPPPGLDPSEIDVGEDLRHNAASTNEGHQKTRTLLEYLRMFEENQIVDMAGFKHLVLSRQLGFSDEAAYCLRPYFVIKDKRVRARFENVHIAVPGGDGGGLIPLPIRFQGVYLDDLEANSTNSMDLSDGEWSAWFTMDGLDAVLEILDASDDPPTASSIFGDKLVWHCAKWTVEGSGGDARVTEFEAFTCPFLPALRQGAGHAGFPHFYQKRKTLKTQDLGPPLWYFKGYYASVTDIQSGLQLRCVGADNETEHAVAAGQSWWFHLATSNEGLPTAYELIQAAAVTQQPFQQEETPEAPGQTGDYYSKAFDVVSIGTVPHPRLVARVWAGSDLYWYRWLHKNVGGGERVYKMFNTTDYKHEFRTLVGSGDTLVYEDGDTIVIETVCTGS